MHSTEDTTSAPPAQGAKDEKLFHDDEVAQLAYHFYLERGRLDGHNDEDWHRAEQYFRNLRSGDSSVTRSAT